MTTIAYRDGVMAGDRATRYGSVIGHETTKVVRRADGALCGTAGTTTIASSFRRWFLALEADPKPSLGDDKEDIHAIIARPNGTVEIHDRMGWGVVEGEFFAIGVGAEIALGAMAMGADAETAVKVAARFGVGLEAAIDSVRTSEKPPAPPTVSDREEGERPAREETKAFVRDILENTFGQQTTDEQVEDVAQQIDALAPPAPEVRKEDEQDAAVDWTNGGEDRLDAVCAELLKDLPPPQEAPAIPEGFIPWSGGECPVPHGTVVDIICRDPDIRVGQTNEVFAHMISWANEGNAAYDIIAYRVVEPATDKPLIVDDTPTIPRSEIPQGAAVETFTDAGVETVKLSGITHIVDDAPERVAETQPDAAYAPIHNVDEPATSEQLAAAGIIEPGASEMAAMRLAKSKPSFIERVLGIPPTPKQTAEEGV